MADEYRLLEGLIFSCPMDKELENCPFIQIRQMSIDERLSLLEELSSIRKDELVRHHQLCLKRREGSFKK